MHVACSFLCWMSHGPPRIIRCRPATSIGRGQSEVLPSDRTLSDSSTSAMTVLASTHRQRGAGCRRLPPALNRTGGPANQPLVQPPLQGANATAPPDLVETRPARCALGPGPMQLLLPDVLSSQAPLFPPHPSSMNCPALARPAVSAVLTLVGSDRQPRRSLARSLDRDDILLAWAPPAIHVHAARDVRQRHQRQLSKGSCWRPPADSLRSLGVPPMASAARFA
jgi:hypothetical protein